MEDGMKNTWLRLLPWAFVALFAIEIIAVVAPKKDGAFHVREFARLPVLHGGRIQPFDSLARNSLLQIRSTGDVPLEEVPGWKFWHHPQKLKATEWLLEVMTRPEVADTRPIFLIHLPDLLGELKLQNSGIEKSGLRYYTFDQIKPVIPEVAKQAARIVDREDKKASTPEQRTVFENQVMKLFNAVSLYRRLKFTLQPEGVDDFSGEIVEFQRNLGPARAAAQASQDGKKFDEDAIRRMAGPLQAFQMMADFGYALVVPPANPAMRREQWQNAGAALIESARSEELNPGVTNLAAIATAYRAKNAEAFNQAVAGYQAWLSPRFDKELNKGRAEFFYNDIKAFLHAMIIYLFAFVLACGALLTRAVMPGLSEALRRSAFYIIILACVVHTAGLVFRMVLEGRPPVTNLYSSAIFIGWAVVVLGLILERIYRVGIGSMVAALAGFATLIIAHNLALGGDTMEMLRAVLDTNGWLATHVVTVTLGYASTFAAGILAILYVFMGVFTRGLKQSIRNESADPSGAGKVAARGRQPEAGDLQLGKALSKMVYGIICFATLFSFIGTVLGGIWADQSWGRFWGWDPKENGALMIVIWNAVILHARWGGMVRERGIMNLAIFGNIVTSFSWFGVNLLGIGLHSYGFTDSGGEYLFNFVVGQAAMLGNGLLCAQLWLSVSAEGGNGTGKFFRNGLIALDIVGLTMALIWFGGIYGRSSFTWFGGLYDAMPWLTLFGKIGAYTSTALIWVLAGASWLPFVSRSEPQPAMPRVAPVGAR
jgi:cytochrome c-type biogenesis protein CcsB